MITALMFWPGIPVDTRLLFSTRILRLFAYGFLSVILALYLSIEQASLAQLVSARQRTGISALSAAWVAGKIDLINTMVFTHLPSNVLLMLVPFMPSLGLAIAVLLLRFSISQMDVPARQSSTMAVVDPDERSVASGVTNVARTIGASISPVFAGLFLSNPLFLGLPFVISGGLKIVYDLALFFNFRSLKPPEERPQSSLDKENK